MYNDRPAKRRLESLNPGPLRVSAGGDRSLRSRPTLVDSSWIRTWSGLSIQVESAFQPSAESHKGAMGLMQLMPETARVLSVQDPWDPNDNVQRWHDLSEASAGQIRRPVGARPGGLQCRSRERGPVRRHSAVRRDPLLCRERFCACIATSPDLSIPPDRLLSPGSQDPSDPGQRWEVCPDHHESGQPLNSGDRFHRFQLWRDSEPAESSVTVSDPCWYHCSWWFC